jgi:tRNA pseudouridine38-40 synthase
MDWPPCASELVREQQLFTKDYNQSVRYFFEISYNGKNYNGWQSQKNGIGIQAVVEEAMKTLLQEPVEIVASGRTDAGVHCEQQFFHCDITKVFDEGFLKQKLNSFLPADIAIRSIQKVNGDASARYDAIERSYRYQITRSKNPFMTGYAWHYFKEMDFGTMNTAAALLLGEQDFECFSKVHTDVNHFVCNIKSATWHQNGELVTFSITANRFLRGMVRAIVGTLLDVGSGRITVGEFEKIIKSKDRKKAGANVPPYGLYLASVRYRDSIYLN